EEESAIYRSIGVPIFTSASELFSAVRGLAGFHSRTAPAEVPGAPGSGAALRGRAAGPLDDDSAKALLAEYGIAFPAERVVTTAEDARAFAEQTGYPVA